MIMRYIYAVLSMTLIESLAKDPNENADFVQILSVSTKDDQVMSPLCLGYRGGTLIYLKIQGLDPLQENNEVFIGYQQCMITQFNYDKMSLNCIAYDSYENAELSIKVKGKQTSSCTLGNMYCQVSLKSTEENRIVKIEFVSPSLNYANKEFIVKAKIPSNNPKSNNRIIFDMDYGNTVTISYLQQFYEGFNKSTPQQEYYRIQLPSNFFQSYGAIYSVSDDQKSVNKVNYYIAPIITGLNVNVIEGLFTKMNIYGSNFGTGGARVFIGGKENSAVILAQDEQQIQVQLPNLTNLFLQQQQNRESQLYLSGSGFFYTLYNISDFPNFSYLVDDFRNSLINQPDLFKNNIIFDGIHPTLDCFVNVPYKSGQYFRGFFMAPLTGNYKFFLATNGNASLHISQQNFTVFSNSTPFARSQNALYRNYWFNNSKKSTTDQLGQISDINLTKGCYYFIEIFNVYEANIDGFITLSIEIQDDDYRFEDYFSKRKSMQYVSLSTSYNAVKEIIGLKVYNNKGNILATGSYQIQFKQTKVSDQYYITRTLSLQTSPQNLKAEIELSTPYLVSISYQKVNKEGQTLNNDITDFAGYLYTITFDSYRGDDQYRTLPEIAQLTLSNEFSYQFESVIIQQPKGPIYGTFQLNLLNQWGSGQYFKMPDGSIDLPFDIDPNIINDFIASNYWAESEVWCFGKAQDGRSCYFKSSNTINFSVQSSLKSDSSDVQLISHVEYQTISHFFEPIAISLVYTYYDKPQVQVQIYNTIIGCEVSKCGIQLNIQTITLSNFILQQDDQFQVNFIPPKDSVMNSNDFAGSLARGDCIGIQITQLDETHYSLQCEIEKQNGKAIREAGSKQLPVIINKIYGQCVFQTNVVGLETDLKLDSISPTFGSPYGGTLVTLKGSGFPKDKNSQFQLKIGTNSITPISISNQEIKFKTQYIDGMEKTYNIILTFNGKNAQILFNYKNLTSYNITGLDNTKLPEFTETLKIFGNNLGDSIDNVQITLYQFTYFETIVDQIKIVSITSTMVEIQTKFLQVGSYCFSYSNNLYGNFNQRYCGLIGFKITKFDSVYLVDGKQPYISLSGGALIKIVGIDYVVNKTFIRLDSFSDNERCDIDYGLSVSKILFCKISVRNQRSINTPKSIKIFTQLQNGTSYSIMIDSVLIYDTTQTPFLKNYPENLQNQDQSDQEETNSLLLWSFNIGRAQRSQYLMNYESHYSSDQTRLLLRRRKLYNPGDIETLTGTYIQGTVWVKFEGPITQIIQAQVKDSTITYKIPNLPQGDFKTFIYTLNGNFDKKWITEISFSVDSISTIYRGGGRMIIKGTGFNLDKKLKVTLNNLECKNIEVRDFHEIYCDYYQQETANAKIILQQISSSNDSILTLQQTQPIQVSNYFLNKIFINSQEFQLISSTLIEITTGQVRIRVGDAFSGDGFVKLSNILIQPINSANNYEATFDQLPIGKYQIQVWFNNQTAEVSIGQLTLNVQADSTQSFSIDKQYQSSFLGGQNIAIGGFGFSSEKTKVSICGFQCQIKDITFTNLVCEAPKIQSDALFNKYPLLSQTPKQLELDDLEIVSDNQYYLFNLFDKKQATYFETILNSDKSVCSIVFNSKQNLNLNLKSLRFSTISNSTLDYSSLKFCFQDAKLNWQLMDFGYQIKQGWNTFNPPQNFPQQIKAIKLTDSTLNQKSACQISEIEIYGLVQSDSMYDDQNDSITCDVNVFTDDNLITSFKDAVVYSNLVEVSNVSPLYGEISAQEVITITGQGFVPDKTIILIDTIKCDILTLTETQVTCKTGIKDITKVKVNGNFEVSVDGSKALIYEQFIYIQKWSNSQTWGGWTPQNQTSLIIDQNQTILLDIPYISMNKLIVDGILIFSDELDINLQINIFAINQGKLIIGTERNPHKHNVLINFSLDSYLVQKQNMIGYKGLACLYCQIDIHGNEKSPSWSLLNKNALKGDQTIEIIQSVKWSIGDQLLISSKNIQELEYRLISSISQDKKIITIDHPLTYDHLNCDDYSIEIAVLGRNIQFFGSDPTQDTNGHLIGFHFKIIGSADQGTKVRISNTAFFKGGQVTDENLFYPIYFYQNQNLGGSYLRENYFNNNLGPQITIENAFNLEVSSNVLLNNSGHGIYLKSGKEINNIIINNLVQGVSPSKNYDKSTSKPASFWISNPQNTVVNNRAIGSAGIGFFFQINPNQFCLNESFISGFEENLVRETQSFALIVNIIPSYCQNRPVRTQLIKSFNSFNNINGDLLVLAEMSQQYHKAKYYFNQTQRFGLQVQFSKNFYFSEQSAIFQVNYTFSSLLQAKKQSSNTFTKLNQTDFPSIKNCLDGQWFNDNEQKILSICLSKMTERIFDEIIIFENEPQNINGVEFYGTTGSNYQGQLLESNSSIPNGNESTGTGTETDTGTETGSENGTNTGCGSGGSGSSGNGTDTGSGSGGNGSGSSGSGSSGNGTDTGSGSGGSGSGGSGTGGSGTNTGSGSGGSGSSGNGTDTGSGSGGSGTDTGSGSGGSGSGGSGSGGSDSGGSGSGGSGSGGSGSGNDAGSGTGEAVSKQFNWTNGSAWQNKRSPIQDEDVVIEEGKIIYLDTNPPILRKIVIFGSLIITEATSQRILEAQEISIMKSGKFIVGTAEVPYKSEFIIKTNKINSQNGIQIISNTDVTTWTKLTNYAESQTKSIQVNECKGWKIGDSILISTSSPEPSENEKHKIVNIKDCEIFLQDPLSYDHYGAANITLRKSGFELDMRTVVLNLNRKIKVSGLDNSCSVVIEGLTILQGVEFENCGSQRESGILLQNQNGSIATQILSCSFHEFNGQMIKITNSDNLIVKNNVFFDGIQQLVEIIDYNSIQFNNNALVYVKRGMQKVWAVLGNFIYTKLQVMARNNQDFSQNVGVASEDAGFYILTSACMQSDSASFYNLFCSSAVNSCFVIKQFSSTCDYIGKLSAYNSGIGIMNAINTEKMIIDQIVAAENKINIIIKGTTQGQINNQIHFSNSYITALARPECSQCYQTKNQIQNCQNSLGMQMATISSYTYSLIEDNFTSNQYDAIQTNQRLDIRVALKNVIFDSFRLQYSQTPNCQFNSVFRQHPKAFDVTGRHYLINSPCVNCEFDALLYKFRDSNYSQIGAYNGCGSMECIGMKNTLISDNTGDFFGEISQAIGNNTNYGIYSKNSCIYKSTWNGFWCKGNSIQVLNFMSTAPDFAKRLFSPVRLMENRVVFNILNSFYEWNWNGAIPKNTRESKFAGLVAKNKSISINVAGVNPTSSIFWLSSSPQNNEQDYQVISWQFQESLVVQVVMNNQVILPGITTIKKHYNLYEMTKKCGANNFFSQNRTIQFVLTNEDFCVITISLRNSVSVSTTLAVTDSFDADYFLSYLRQQFGGDPQNYYIFSIKPYQRRFLTESESSIEVQWGFVDSSEVGTQLAENNIKLLEDISERLLNSIYPSDLGTLISQSSSITQLPYLNYTSSEEQPQVQSNQSGSQNSNGSDQNNNGNSNDNNSTNIDEVFNPVENESVNFESPSSNNSLQTENQIEPKSSQKDYTLTIVLAVVLPILGVAIIFGIIFYIRKKKPDRQILYTCTTSAAEFTVRPAMKNNHSKQLSIATPVVQEGNALVVQTNPEQNQ